MDKREWEIKKEEKKNKRKNEKYERIRKI